VGGKGAAAAADDWGESYWPLAELAPSDFQCNATLCARNGGSRIGGILSEST